MISVLASLSCTHLGLMRAPSPGAERVGKRVRSGCEAGAKRVRRSECEVGGKRVGAGAELPGAEVLTAGGKRRR